MRKEYYWNCLGTQSRSKNVPIARKIIRGAGTGLYGKMFGERMKVSLEKSGSAGLICNPTSITFRDTIRSFYDGVKIEVEDNFPKNIVVVLCGRYGEYTVNELSKVLGLSSTGPRCPVEVDSWVFDDECDESSQLTPIEQLRSVTGDTMIEALNLPHYDLLPVFNQKLLDVVRSTLLPRNALENELETLTFKEVFVLGHIVAEKPINFASLVMGFICNVLASNDLCLCYDVVIGKLFHDTYDADEENYF